MPRAKKDSNQKSVVSSQIKSKKKTSDNLFEEEVKQGPSESRRFSKLWLIPIVFIGLCALIYANRSHFIAALVNGQPIAANQVNTRLNQAYRKAILDEIINETILEQEARKKGVSVIQSEIEEKLQAEEETYGGKEVFESLLAQQGMTREDYAKRIRLVLLMEKLYAAEATPTDEDIKAFMEMNAKLPEATDEAKFKALAIEQVRQQKISEVISTKFPELKKASSIQIF